MKDYRLDLCDWYDKDNDLICCLICEEKFEWLHGNHLKKHGLTTEKYKKRFNILPKTPLKNKKTLQANREHMIRLRKKGLAKVFKKGETSIPLSYRKVPVNVSAHPEARKLSSEGLKGTKHSPEHRAKILATQRANGFFLHEHGVPFKKGHAHPNKGKKMEDVLGVKEAVAWKTKISNTRKERIESGEIVPFQKGKSLISCAVCGKRIEVSPYKKENPKYRQKTCSLSCSGKMGGRGNKRI